VAISDTKVLSILEGNQKREENFFSMFDAVEKI
jgi:hypothetical protein